MRMDSNHRRELNLFAKDFSVLLQTGFCFLRKEAAMIIKKVLNNNVAIIENKKGFDQIVCGRGIAFKKKPGDSIDESLVNQIFILQDQLQNQRFQEIVQNIPIEYISLADDVVNMIKTQLGQKISDSIYITLSDHLFTAIERAKEGILMKNTMLWEIRHYYETEFRIAQDVLKKVREETGVELTDDEAGFITLHIVNSETEDSRLEETMEVTRIVQSITKIVRVFFRTEFNTDSVYYYRFITHLKFFAQRLVYHKAYNGAENDGLLDMVKTKYLSAYKCTEKVAEMIYRNYNYYISDEEKLYLTIHIQRIVFKNNG